MCCYVAGAPSARWRDAGLAARVVARELSRGAAPQPRAPPPLCWRASTCCLSYSPLARVLGPDAGAHVKILVSHGQRGEPRCTSLAARRCASVRNSKFMAARVSWRPLVGPQQPLRQTPARYIRAKSRDTRKFLGIHMIPCTWPPRGRESHGRPGLDGVPGQWPLTLLTRCPARRALGLDMLLTQCAACAVLCPPARVWPLQTLYWTSLPKAALDSGHDMLCKKIKRAAALSNTTQKKCGGRRGRSEKCTATQRARRATSAQAIHWKTGRASCVCVRAAARRAAHVSCWRSRRSFCSRRRRRTNWLEVGERWRGGTRAACEQQHHGVDARSGGRAGRRTWVGRGGTRARGLAMGVLANGLYAGPLRGALSV